MAGMVCTGAGASGWMVIGVGRRAVGRAGSPTDESCNNDGRRGGSCNGDRRQAGSRARTRGSSTVSEARDAGSGSSQRRALAAATSWRSLHGRAGRRPSSRRKAALVAAERGAPAQGPRGVGALALLTAGNDGKAALQGGGGVVEAAELADGEISRRPRSGGRLRTRDLDSATTGRAGWRVRVGRPEKRLRPCSCPAFLGGGGGCAARGSRGCPERRAGSRAGPPLPWTRAAAAKLVRGSTAR